MGPETTLVSDWDVQDNNCHRIVSHGGVCARKTKRGEYKRSVMGPLRIDGTPLGLVDRYAGFSKASMFGVAASEGPTALLSASLRWVWMAGDWRCSQPQLSHWQGAHATLSC
jgi:hypothetical protein